MAESMELEDFGCPACKGAVVFAPVPDEVGDGPAKCASFMCQNEDCPVNVFYVVLGAQNIPDQIMSFNQVQLHVRQHASDLQAFYKEKKIEEGKLN